MKNKFSECTEETLEEKLDRLNHALKYTINDTDCSYHYKRTISQFSNLNSFTTSFCNFDGLEQDVIFGNKDFLFADERIENVFISLDRAQMQVEDFWGEQVRNEENIKVKTEFDKVKVKRTQVDKKNEVKMKIEEVENMIKSLKVEKNKVRNYETTLKNREKELVLKENQFDANQTRHKRLVVGKNMEYIDDRNLNLLRIKDLDAYKNLFVSEIENNPMLVELKQELDKYEMELKKNKNQDKRKKLIFEIYKITNKIATIRGERVIMDCSKGLKFKNVS